MISKKSLNKTVILLSSCIAIVWSLHSADTVKWLNYLSIYNNFTSINKKEQSIIQMDFFTEDEQQQFSQVFKKDIE